MLYTRTELKEMNTFEKCKYGHENEMYNVGVSLKEGEGL